MHKGQIRSWDQQKETTIYKRHNQQGLDVEQGELYSHPVINDMEKNIYSVYQKLTQHCNYTST